MKFIEVPLERLRYVEFVHDLMEENLWYGGHGVLSAKEVKEMVHKGLFLLFFELGPDNKRVSSFVEEGLDGKP